MMRAWMARRALKARDGFERQLESEIGDQDLALKIGRAHV
jgi:hypothetical protein